MHPTCAVITGASSGIGEAFARELASKKVNLVLVARRKERLEKLAAELSKAYGISVETIALDLALPGSAEKLFAASTRDGKSIDLLINNAGVGAYRYFLRQELSQHMATIQLNLVTLTELTHRFSEHMLKHGRPAYIANIASIAAYQGVPRFAVYAATKSFVRILSTVLNRELRGTSLSVTCVCPGGTATEFLESNGQSLKSGKSGMMMSAEEVVKISLKGIFARKTIVVPGLLNKIACLAPRLLPMNFAMTLAEIAMSSAVQEKISLK